METAASDLHVQAKKTDQDPKETVGHHQTPDQPQHHPPLPPSTMESEKSHCQDDPSPGVRRGGDGGKEEGVDIISTLPDAVLGEIIFLLPTKDAARTQALSSRWRHVWRSAPLNLDHTCLSFKDGDALEAFIFRTIDAHQGSVRRLSVPERFLYHRASAVKAWLRSPALDNLEELEFYSAPLPRFRYTKSKTLPRLRLDLLRPS